MQACPVMTNDYLFLWWFPSGEIPDMKIVKARSLSTDRPRTQHDGKVVRVKTEFPVASLVLNSIAGCPASQLCGLEQITQSVSL